MAVAFLPQPQLISGCQTRLEGSPKSSDVPFLLCTGGGDGGLPCIVPAVRLQEIHISVPREKRHQLVVGPVEINGEESQGPRGPRGRWVLATVQSQLLSPVSLCANLPSTPLPVASLGRRPRYAGPCAQTPTWQLCPTHSTVLGTPGGQVTARDMF